MKTYYKIVMSAKRDEPIAHLPYTLARKYRSAKRAFNHADKLHKDNRTVVVVELCKEGMLATWEFPAGGDRMIFDCNEELCASLEQRGVI